MSVVLLPPGLYQVSPSNQQNVETTSVIKEYLRIKVCSTNIAGFSLDNISIQGKSKQILFRRNNYYDDIDVSQTNKLSHWINDRMDGSRYYMAGWCANIILKQPARNV